MRHQPHHKQKKSLLLFTVYNDYAKITPESYYPTDL